LPTPALVVQFVLLVLLLFSVASWSIIFIKFRYLRKAFLESADFTEFFWKSRDLSGAFARAKQFDISPVARVFRIGYLELKRISRAGGSGMREKSDDDAMSNRISGSDNVQRALRRAGVPGMREKSDDDDMSNRISGSDNVQRALRGQSHLKLPE
jgi:biopolymer transport protein TolQ